MKYIKSLPISELQVSRLEQLNSEEAQVCTSDPASFMIACMVIDRLRTSVSELKALICEKNPELEIGYAKVISAMEKLGIIRIFGDHLTVIKSAHYADYDKSEDWGFLPKVAATICRRVLKASKANALSKAEGLRWYHVPKHPVIESRLLEIHRRYAKEMEDLIEWVRVHPELAADKVQLSMVVVSDLDPEDF
jgi:hypothetical protein